MATKPGVRRGGARKAMHGSVKGGPPENAKRTPNSVALDWKRLLDTSRIDGPDRKLGIESTIVDHRTPHEKDYDRTVFCTAVRRLKDKTQVFPLDMHDGVRTRLTHSIEVSNLARSMGIAVVQRCASIAAIKDAGRNVPALLAATALTHDLGNPPFGHQGEEAIRTWVRENQDRIRASASEPFAQSLLTDFLMFEGNAQGLRILSRLQHQDHKSGMRLTSSTLRAFMKYPWLSTLVGTEGGPSKFGCFHSEKRVFEWISTKTGLKGAVRHPLSYLMEVCDDIAYSVLDVEDAIKKDLVSVADLIAFMVSSKELSADQRVRELKKRCEADTKWLNQQRVAVSADKKVPLSNKEIRDSQIEILRSYAIGLMVSDAIEMFVELESRNGFGELKKGIAEEFKSAKLISAFKSFAYLRIYKHPLVLKAELPGHKIIPALMTAFWNSVSAHSRGKQTKIDEYVRSLMSPNYVRVFFQSTDLGLPEWYRQLQLVCDQVCGMTDSYSVRTFETFQDFGVL